MRLLPTHNTGVVPPYLTTGNTGIVPPYLQDKLQPVPLPCENTGIVPPYLQEKLRKGQLLPDGNTGIVPPYLQEKLRKGQLPPNGNTGVVPPSMGGDCFPDVPAQKDESGVEVIFTDVKLPTARRPLVDLTGGAPRFTQLPVRGGLFSLPN